MTSRILPREEWGRLQGTELEQIVTAAARRDNEVLLVLVAEDKDGAIVGGWALFPIWHAEGLWVSPNHRGKAAVGRRLLRFARAVAEQFGISAVMTAANSSQVARMLDAIGMRLPGTHYLLPLTSVREEPCQPQSQYH